MGSIAQASVEGTPPNADSSTTTTATIDPAAGEPGDVTTNTYDRGFDITNLSGHRLRLDGYVGAAGEDQLPGLSAIVEPARAIGFQIAWLCGKNHDVAARFSILDSRGSKIGSYTATRWPAFLVR